MPAEAPMHTKQGNPKDLAIQVRKRSSGGARDRHHRCLRGSSYARGRSRCFSPTSSASCASNGCAFADPTAPETISSSLQPLRNSGNSRSRSRAHQHRPEKPVKPLAAHPSSRRSGRVLQQYLGFPAIKPSVKARPGAKERLSHEQSAEGTLGRSAGRLGGFGPIPDPLRRQTDAEAQAGHLPLEAKQATSCHRHPSLPRNLRRIVPQRGIGPEAALGGMRAPTMRSIWRGNSRGSPLPRSRRR